MAVTFRPTPTGADSELHVDRFGLSIGRVSVGLPMTCTRDMVLLRYMDLIKLIQQDSVDWFSPPDADVAVLAAAIRSNPKTVRARLETFAG